ncbi:MAG: M56 family metallopeptidase, partial [Clostridia bacterium]|nr:M56 family metallopeptidase [Clostridia bacterium]
MIGRIFYWVLNMSITATVTGLVVLAVRSVRAVPRRVAVFLWTVPLIRMCLPFGIGNRYSLMSLISRFTTKTVIVARPLPKVKVSMTNSMELAREYFPLTFKSPVLDKLFVASGIVWIAAFAVILAVIGAVYVSSLRKTKPARHEGGNVWTSGEIQSPAVYGIIKPKIVLPDSLGEQDKRYVVMHEAIHARRGDNLWRLIGFVTAAIHWFNPMAWVFLKFFLTDLELACDESVLQACGEDEKKRYAKALVFCAEHKTLFVSAFGGAKIRTRIERIVSFRKMTAVSTAAFLI